MKESDQEFMELESLVDRFSLVEVVRTLSEICYGKAEHLRSDWQDASAAKIWERDARKLETLADKIYN